jgi:hypothetical protein
MRDLFTWTSMSSAHAVVDQELRHRHRQGKSSGLAVFQSGWMYIVFLSLSS